MSTPRLIIVTPHFWPSVGRVPRYVGRLVETLPGAGWKVTVVAPRWIADWPERLSVDESPVVRLDPAPVDAWTRWQYGRRLGRWLRRNTRSEDIVLAVGLRHDAATVMHHVGRRAATVLFAPRAGRASDAHWLRESAGGRRLSRSLLKADAVIAPSDAVRSELDAAGFPGDRIDAIPWGVPIVPSRLRARRAKARRVLAEASDVLRVPDWAPIGLCIGRLDADRGLPPLVAAWEPITRQWPNARLWLVGRGPERTHLDRQISGLRLTGRVQMLGVFEHVETLLDAADLLIAPAPADDVALPVLEALGAGLPVVAADAPGHRAVVEHDRTGLLVPPDDADDLHAAIFRLIDAPPLAARLGEAGRRMAAECWPLEAMVERHVALFERLRKNAG